MRAAYWLGEEQITTAAWFLAEERSIEGPPISMFSMQVSKLYPFATVSSKA